MPLAFTPLQLHTVHHLYSHEVFVFYTTKKQLSFVLAHWYGAGMHGILGNQENGELAEEIMIFTTDSLQQTGLCARTGINVHAHITPTQAEWHIHWSEAAD